MKRLYLVMFAFVCHNIMAQNMWDNLATSEYRIDSTDVKALRVEVDNLSFFHDNEYSGKLAQGYTLPGLWIQPKLTYNPIKQIGLEVGLHALIFNGANKYPCYAYHDIGTWKGNQYQSGVHLLPWVRAKAQFKYLTIVLGNIYGGQNHQLIEPLFNPELNISQDPEMGFQLLWDRPHLHADIWLNWQSYIFKMDTHQEAFTVGMNWTVYYNKPESKISWFSPIQVVIQHRGGEQIITPKEVQTISNTGLGVGMKWNANRKALKHLGAEINMLAAYQQSGQLWPFKTGLAVHAGLNFNLWDHLGINTSYLYAPKHFVSLYGNPLYNTVSQIDQTSFDGNNTISARVSYHYVIAKHYVVGAQAEAYQTWLPKHNELNFDFGIYLRVNPNFLIKKW